MAKKKKVAKVFHETDRGVKIEIRAVPPFLLDRMDATIPIPEIPTYTTTTVAGEEEVIPHDETTLETDEDKQAWAVYQQAIIDAEEQENENMMKVLIIEGIHVDMEGEAFDDWKKRQAFYGLTIPEDELELKQYYVETEVLSSLTDLGDIMMKVMLKSGVDPEVAEQALASFQIGIRRVAALETAVKEGEVEA